MPRILVIEDETNLRENIIDILRLEGYDVLSAPDGSAGVEVARQAQPELIICDIAMPVMDGYDALLHLRSHPDTVSTPFIFLTARADRTNIRHGMELGADDYITKPFSKAELLAAVQSRLKRRDDVFKKATIEVEAVKKRLARLISHELRTPMNSITLAQHMITQQFDQLSKEDIKELLAIFVADSRRLSHLTEQVVLMTHIDTGLLNPVTLQNYGQNCEIVPIIASAINMARDFARRNHDGEIQTDEHAKDALLHCHPPSLTHALAELIVNGLDFSPPDSPVQLTQWQVGDRVWVQVSDQGRGIPLEDIEEALKPFEQIRREKYEQQGLGLGLSLAKEIVEIHGGSLQIQSGLDQGTTVYVSLPRLVS
jgi:signal transduction histidine kinase